MRDPEDLRAVSEAARDRIAMERAAAERQREVEWDDRLQAGRRELDKRLGKYTRGLVKKLDSGTSPSALRAAADAGRDGVFVPAERVDEESDRDYRIFLTAEREAHAKAEALRHRGRMASVVTRMLPTGPPWGRGGDGDFPSSDTPTDEPWIGVEVSW